MAKVSGLEGSISMANHDISHVWALSSASYTSRTTFRNFGVSFMGIKDTL